MSNQPLQDPYMGDGGELPPPYSPEPPTAQPSAAAASSTMQHTDSLFASRLASLRGQIGNQQAARASLQDQSDTRLLSLLTAHVEDMLDSVVAAGAADPPPQLVQTTLVPDGALSPDWVFAEAYRDRSGEVHNVVRVQMTQPSAVKGVEGGGEKQPLPLPLPHVADDAGRQRRRDEPEFDGWGRWGEDAAGSGAGGASSRRSGCALWWSDEDMARRLAKYLQPPTPPPPPRKAVVVAVDRPTVAAKAAEAKKARSRWNILGGSSSKGSAAAAPATPPIVQVEDDVSMNVAAEEVTFRRENEMGIWESNTGWGIVVRVRIRLSGSRRV